MANAVEDAAVVIMCMSENYKNSASCRTEADYAYNLRKPIIPIRTQPDYIARGWLGAIAGTRLYFDCWSIEQVPSTMPAILKQLGDYLQFSPTVFYSKI